VAAAGGDGGRAGWGAYPRSKPAPRWHGCHRPRPVGTAATARARRCRGGRPLDAKRRRLPHWGCGNVGERIRSARSLRRRGPVRWPTKRHCGKRSGGDRTGPDAGGCHKAEATGNARKACHTRAGWYLRSTPCGRPVPVPVWRAKHAPRVRARGRVVWQPSTRSGGGCHRWASPRKPRRRQEDGRASRASRPDDCRRRGARNLEPGRCPEGAAGLRRHPLPPEQPPSSE